MKHVFSYKYTKEEEGTVIHTYSTDKSHSTCSISYESVDGSVKECTSCKTCGKDPLHFKADCSNIESTAKNLDMCSANSTFPGVFKVFGTIGFEPTEDCPKKSSDAKSGADPKKSSDTKSGAETKMGNLFYALSSAVIMIATVSMVV